LTEHNYSENIISQTTRNVLGTFCPLCKNYRLCPSFTGMYVNDTLTKKQLMGGKNVKTCNGLYVQVYTLRPAIHTARPCVAGSNVMVRCQSVCLFQHGPTTANPLLQVCQTHCCRFAAEPGGQEISIDCSTASA